MRIFALVIVSAGLAVVGAADGLQPLGGEFQVNSTAANNYIPRAAVGPDRGFAVVWRNTASASNPDYNVVGRFFSPEGMATGNDFSVATNTTGTQVGVHLAFAPDGKSAASWASQYSAAVQLFDSVGLKVGSEFPINTHTTHFKISVAVTASPSGDYVFTWNEDSPADDDGIVARRISSTGTPLGDEFLVNTYIGSDVYEPRIDSAPDGRFVIVWEDWGHPSEDSGGVFARRYLLNGTAQGDPIHVNTYTTGMQRAADVTVGPDGRFVVVWEGPGSAGSEIFGQRFAADGSVDGLEFQANSFTTGNQGDPAVAAAPDGSFLVVWHCENDPQDGDGYSIRGRHYTSSGVPLDSDDFLVNSFTTGSQSRAHVDAGEHGDYLVVWRSFTVDNDTVQARRYETAWQLSNGWPLAGIMAGPTRTGSWTYYYFDVPPGSTNLLLDLYSLSNDLDLFVRAGDRPDAATYDCRSFTGGSAPEHCEFATPVSGRWWLGVSNYVTGVGTTYLVNATWTVDELIFADGFETGDVSAWAQ